MNISKIEAGSGSGERPDLLTPFEIESYVGAIQRSTVLELGSLSWLDKHERIKQLAIQAVIQALSNREETVKDFIISLDKLEPLVYDLILVEIWKERVFPELVKSFDTSAPGTENGGCGCGFAIYPILYHESALINLLEAVLFHPSAAEGLGDGALDLADYCLRTLTHFLTTGSFGDDDDVDDDKESGSRGGGSGDASTGIHLDVHLIQQRDTLGAGCALRCFSILRYLIENVESLGHGLTSRLLVSTDTPMLLTELIVQKPWRKEYWRTGKILELDPVSGGWKEIDPAARMMISNTEAQAWLSLYLLLKNNGFLTSYEMYDARRNNLLKLRPFLNDLALDQLPILGELGLFLNQLAVTSGPFGPSRSPLLLELVPAIRTALEKEFDTDKERILRHYCQELVTGSASLLMEKARRLVAAYDLDNFAAVLPLPQPCAKEGCPKTGDKRCSRCKAVWYCGKECQVSDWRLHRDKCDPKV